MGFKSNMPYAMNTQLQQQVDDKQARDKAAFAPGGMNDGTPWYQKESYLRATGQEIPEKPIEKVEWANGLGNNIDGRYENFQLSDELRYSEDVVSDRDRTGMSYHNAARDRGIIQSEQDLLTYGPAGKPNITNNNMNNTQDPSLIDPANVGESGQLNTFNDPTRQMAQQRYGGQLEKTASMMNSAVSPFGMKTNPPSSTYNAMDALKSHYNSGQNLNLSQSGQTNNPYRSSGLPGLPTSSTGSGGVTGVGGQYSNPASTGAGVTINTTPPASTTPKYSFLTDQDTSTFDKSKLDNSEHRMSFLGLYKRNAKSLEARITDATLNGRTKKAARLNKKLTNFENNQKNPDNFLQRTGKKIGSLFS